MHFAFMLIEYAVPTLAEFKPEPLWTSWWKPLNALISHSNLIYLLYPTSAVNPPADFPPLEKQPAEIGRLFFYVIVCRYSFIFWNVSSLKSCSTLQASRTAVSSETPRFVKKRVSS